jgi:hypothetical protein
LCPSVSFLILSNSLFTNFPIIQRCSASAFNLLKPSGFFRYHQV